MFLKLYKYDFLSVIKKICFYYIALVCITIFAKLIVVITSQTNYRVIGYFPTMMLYTAMYLGPTISIVLCMIRYYKNMLSDQGYLTHTLPVKRSSILLSKLLVTLTIEFITVLVIGICVFIFSFEAFPSIINFFLKLFANMNPTYANIIGIIILVLVCFILSSVFQVTEVSMCLTLGACHNKNKLLFAFIYYMVINFVLQILICFGVFFLILVIQLIGTNLRMEHAYILLGLIILLISGGIIASYFVNLYFLNRKLNLE